MNWPVRVLGAIGRVIGEASPSCREAARLQSLALDRPLTRVERFGLRFHLLFCKWCRAYGKQIRFLRSAAKQGASEEHQATSQPALSTEARERIKQSLQSGKE